MAQNEDPVLVHTWEQNDTGLTIKLSTGPVVTSDDVNAEFTGRDFHLRLADGRYWHCAFNKEVKKPTCTFIVENEEVCITIEKAVHGETWPDLKASSNSSRSESSSPADTSTSFQPPQTVPCPPPPPPPPLAPSLQPSSHAPIPPALSDVAIQCPPKAYIINHAKNDWFEKDTSSLDLHIYVKQIDKESVDVYFRDQEMTVRFRTSDTKFLKLHTNVSEETLFSWTIHLKSSISPEQCIYKINPYKLDFHLRKKVSERWGSLERVITKASPAAQAGVSSKWMPLSSANSSNTDKEDLGEMAKDVGSEKDVLRGAVGGAKSVDSGADNRQQKPTCTVPPQSHLPGTSQTVTKPELYNPGFTGLDNLGNTCFMNSVLQVLANTRELRDYMLDSNMKNEINYSNPLGTGGTLILTFAVLMRSLWSGKYRSCAPSKLKSTVASKASQFMGFAQHDAQEFMAFLLDGLHEDLNRVKNKPYVEAEDSDDKPDEEIAEVAWQAHKKRNDSFIVDLFQGQYKSKLVCPECGKVSITFDPFMHLSVPLPKKKRVLPVYFFSKDYYRKPVKYVVTLSMDATVDELKSIMADKTHVQAVNLRVFEMYRSRVQKIFNKASSLSTVSNNDIIFVCEVLSRELSGEDVQEVMVMQRMMMPPPAARCSYCRKERESDHSLKHCTKCYRAGYCDRNCQKKHWPTHNLTCRRDLEPLGCPFVISLPVSHCTYARLSQAMEAYARYSTNIFQPPVTATCKPPTSAASPTSKPPSDASEMAEPSIPSRGQGDEAGPAHSQDRVELDVQSMEGETSSSEVASGEVIVDGESDGTKQKTADGVAKATVHGQPQLPERTMPPFFIKPVHMSGHGSIGHNGERLSDRGDTPINIKHYDFLSMDWRNDPKMQNHVLVESKSLEYTEDESVYEHYEEEKSTSLDHCLNLFTEPERLAPDEAWYCPQCKEHREATKQMSLWRLPSSLIIQLKRFSFKNMIWRDKIDKMIRYPVRGLDLSPYCHGVKGPVPPIYDLYGVINHHGGILGGHYTAIGRLPSVESWKKNEHEWRLFDDSHVSLISDKNVCAQSAYLLFYRLRQPYIPYVPFPLEANPPMECSGGPEVANAAGGHGGEPDKDIEDNDEKEDEVEEMSSLDNRDVHEGCVKDSADEIPYTNMEDID
ncbi:ubiquitin carboxyl-terminal hydrolase 19-like [Asterias rubens]|uniref:ubiquitin carboxyl-terminal hydrolase 19-like n=1 Tax=Asterias rubens TaxID=7604 RepID=UPI0014550EEF|nr:ubiquitin carboxyl-terminal hydrolase 19-like [Asterias rubens]XP_033646783.1 ubiquitin carboxyl-terminal hydrolase 19-like [Asterias rubens]